MPAVRWNERLRLIRHSVWNISSLAVSGLVGIFLVPIMLAGLGMERYGVWLTASAVSDIAGGLGFGLGLSLVREVAASADDSTSEETARFVCSSRNIYLLMGVVVMLGLAALSGVFAAGLRLSPATRALVLPAFALIGLAFVGEQLSAFSLAVLAGLRRFDLIGMIAISGSILNATFTFLILHSGRSLVALAMWRAALALVTAVVTSVVIFVLRPDFGRWNTSVDSRSLRSQGGFIVASQVNSVIGKAVFDGVVPLIGFILGAAAIVPYRIGLKFPQFMGVVSGRIAEVLYPASSEYDRAGDSLKAQAALRWGTRFIILANVPVLVTLFVLAPYLLHIWIPACPLEAVTILRISTLAVLFDVAGYTADNLLWGAGLAQRLLKIMLTAGVVTLGVGVLLLFRIGVVGMAVGTVFGFVVGTTLLFRAAAQRYQVRMRDLVGSTTHGLVIPIAFSVIALWAASRLYPPAGWLSLAVVSGVGLVVYAITYYGLTASHDERRMLRGLFADLLATD